MNTNPETAALMAIWALGFMVGVVLYYALSDNGDE